MLQYVGGSGGSRGQGAPAYPPPPQVSTAQLGKLLRLPAAGLAQELTMMVTVGQLERPERRLTRLSDSDDGSDLNGQARAHAMISSLLSCYNS
jgi:hypothetical protein